MTQLAHALYLHGFASGPLTQKGQRLGERLRGAVASYAIPDLEAGDFPGLTMTAILARARAAVAALPDDGAPLLLVGSSLGGYCAALLAAELPRISAVLAIAPAFRFPRFFAGRLGADGLRAGARPARCRGSTTARSRNCRWASPFSIPAPGCPSCRRRRARRRWPSSTAGRTRPCHGGCRSTTPRRRPSASPCT